MTELIDFIDRLIALRESNGYSQRKLAELAGITHTTINSIEKRQTSPCIGTLQKILSVYQISLSNFFTENTAPPIQDIVVQPDELIEIGNDGVSLLLVHDRRDKRKLGFFIETYQPYASTGEKISHYGEEIGTILEGEIVITLDKIDYYLKAGQSYIINTSIPHVFTNQGNKICKIVSAHTPATF